MSLSLYIRFLTAPTKLATKLTTKLRPFWLHKTAGTEKFFARSGAPIRCSLIADRYVGGAMHELYCIMIIGYHKYIFWRKIRCHYGMIRDGMNTPWTAKTAGS